MKHFIYMLIVTALVSCNRIPEQAAVANHEPDIFPDYTSITVPYNMAPMNFNINEEGQKFITRISSENGSKLTISGQEVQVSEKKWKKLLEENKGKELNYEVFVQNNGNWNKFSFKNQISADPIDDYISYRLIEPAYQLYRNISINQRNLTTFKEDKIYSSPVKKQCVNCHSFQDYNRTGNMNLHLRGNEGGTIVTHDGEIDKVNLKTKELPRGGTYVAWHPKENLIAYSVNVIGQFFHAKDNQKVEVMDSYSDLILYDVEKEEVSYIRNTKDEMETFPTWAPDGKALYYASAHYALEDGESWDTENANEEYTKIKYNIYQVSFDPATRKFGEPELVFDAAARGKSATFPKISPDGKYLMFTMADYGNFHIWHKSADLYLMNLETKRVQNMRAVNSHDVESYHSWSSNGRWFIFSSRRIDGSYTRFFISNFDEHGRASKPFILPQKYSGFYKEFLKSYNIPEFMVKPVEYSFRDFAIDGPAKSVSFVSKP